MKQTIISASGRTRRNQTIRPEQLRCYLGIHIIEEPIPVALEVERRYQYHGSKDDWEKLSLYEKFVEWQKFNGEKT